MARQLSLGFREEARQPIPKWLGAAYLAFPDNEHPPAQIQQRLGRCSIALDIPIKLRQPVASIGSGLLGVFAVRIGVLMPETSVNENNGSVAWQDNIGLSGKV